MHLMLVSKIFSVLQQHSLVWPVWFNILSIEMQKFKRSIKKFDIVILATHPTIPFQKAFLEFIVNNLGKLMRS